MVMDYSTPHTVYFDRDVYSLFWFEKVKDSVNLTEICSLFGLKKSKILSICCFFFFFFALKEQIRTMVVKTKSQVFFIMIVNAPFFVIKLRPHLRVPDSSTTDTRSVSLRKKDFFKTFEYLVHHLDLNFHRPKVTLFFYSQEYNQ